MQQPPYQQGPSGPYQQPSQPYQQPYQQPSQPYQQPYQQPYPQQYQQPGVPMQYGAPQKDWLTTLLLCVFTGGIGGHRYYTGYTTIGIIQTVTLGGCGIWALIDLIQILTDNYKDANGLPLLKKQ